MKPELNIFLETESHGRFGDLEAKLTIEITMTPDHPLYKDLPMLVAFQDLLQVRRFMDALDAQA